MPTTGSTIGAGDAGNKPYANSELPPELLTTFGFRTADGYFIAAPSALETARNRDTTQSWQVRLHRGDQ